MVLHPRARRCPDRQPVVLVRLDEVVHQQVSLGADDAQRERMVGGDHRVRAQAGRTAGKAEFHVAPFVDTCIAFLGVRTNDRRVAEPAHDVQAVAAEIHQRPAGHLERPSRVGGVGCGHRHPHLDVVHLADRAVGRQLERSAHHRMEQIVEALHHRDARCPRGLGDLLRLGEVARERLLGEHRLARLDRGQVPRRVQ